MKGILYGIGTGPGDSQLMTQKAIEIIRNCGVIALPASSKGNCTAYKIVRNMIPEIDSKEFLLLDFPMTKEKTVLENAHKNAAVKISEALDKGKSIAFITIGDVTVYSTFIYIKDIIEGNGFKTEFVNGIPSFCAAAARLGISLSEQNEQIHIIPGSYKLNDSFNLNGTLVFMKSGKKLGELKKFLLQKKDFFDFDFYGISNCGMENENIYGSINELSEDASYFTIVIIKNVKKKENEKNYKFFQNTKCEMFPCHKTDDTENFNCLFCYCPLYHLGGNCGGNFKFTGNGVKSCIDCLIPHQKDNYGLINQRLKDFMQSECMTK